jgi:urease accessory protein
MGKIIRTTTLSAAFLGIWIASAEAHTGVGATIGFTHGFDHPIRGLDHVLAMVAVGMFAVTLGGRALWLVPASFVGMMAVGGLLGSSGMNMPLAEFAIAASVIVLGGLVAMGTRLPTAAAMVIVGFFAIFHGHAHGAEMPADAAGLSYGLGFLMATALLHATGIAGGFGIAQARPAVSQKAMRAAGAITAALGLGIFGGHV